MSIDLPAKINQLLQKLPKGVVITNSWLKENGISTQLKQRYIDSHWLESLGYGACKRYNDSINWPGAVWGVLQQGSKIHVGGKTALSLQGLAHYARINELVILFKESRGELPHWFYHLIDSKKLRLVSTKFLPIHLGLSELTVEGLNIPVSQPERALFEHIYFIGKGETFEETSLLMEAMTGLRPHLLQQLLGSCTSIKVKRTFLFLAEYHAHGWFNKIDINSIKLGAGKRQIVADGVLDKKYQITVPKGFLNEHGKNIY
jgi:hypothetical protein